MKINTNYLQMKFIFIFTLFLGLQVTAQKQTTVINYQTWTGASGCNIFASATSVPATLNGTTNLNLTHLSTIGEPSYGITDNAVALNSNSTGTM